MKLCKKAAQLKATLTFSIDEGECYILATACHPENGETYSIRAKVNKEDNEKKTSSVIRRLIRALDLTFHPQNARVVNVPDDWDSMSLSERGNVIEKLTKDLH